MNSKKKVLFVCLGNICRSPLAEGILKHKLKERELEERFQVDSCGTGNWHVGEQPDMRTLENARENGIHIVHSARQLQSDDFIHFDEILVMDQSNLSNAQQILENKEYADKLQLMRDYDPKGDGEDVPDPYFGGPKGFQIVFDILDRSIDNWLEKQINS